MVPAIEVQRYALLAAALKLFEVEVAVKMPLSAFQNKLKWVVAALRCSWQWPPHLPMPSAGTFHPSTLPRLALHVRSGHAEPQRPPRPPEFVRLLGLRGRQLRIRVLSGVVVRGSTVRIFLPLDNAAEEVATIPNDREGNQLLHFFVDQVILGVQRNGHCGVG